GPWRGPVRVAAGLSRRGGRLASRGGHASRDGVRRDRAAQGPSGAVEPGLPGAHPAVARGHAAGHARAHQPQADGGPAVGRPDVPAGPVSPGQRDRAQPARRDVSPLPGRLRGGDQPGGGIMSYPSDRIFEEVAYVARYLHWPYDQVMALDHRERQRWVTEIARTNEALNEASRSAR